MFFFFNNFAIAFIFYYVHGVRERNNTKFVVAVMYTFDNSYQLSREFLYLMLNNTLNLCVYFLWLFDKYGLSGQWSSPPKKSTTFC